MKSKKILISLMLCAVFMVVLVLVGCDKQINTEDYIRIHIRADSNDNDAQAVKLAVRDEIVGYLSIKANAVSDKNQMLKLIESELGVIEQKANAVLAQNGYSYTCKASLRREDFPTRSYGDLTLPEGNYLALILELGSGKGNNWWCVAYPPLCFIASEDVEGDKVEYRSKIAEFFKNIGK